MNYNFKETVSYQERVVIEADRKLTNTLCGGSSVDLSIAVIEFQHASDILEVLHKVQSLASLVMEETV